MTALLERGRALIHHLSRPKRGELKSCGRCGSGNEPSRGTCRNCGAAL